MHFIPRLLALALAAGALAGPAASPASAQGFSEPQKEEIQRIIKEYLIGHPEVLQEAVSELEKRQAAVEAGRAKEALSKHRDALFNSPRQVVLGDPQGQTTLVEFFDYNCGYCKRALDDMLTLMKGDPKLRIVLKEFPVLGPGSVDAAQVAVAVRMQDKSGGKKYLEFHQKLLGNRGPVDKARALAAAKDAGFDLARIEKDLQSPEVKATLEETMKLGEALGINGTPSYVVGDTVVPGAVGVAQLKQQIELARK
jgi:protein-disulfide isomerase